MSEYTEQAERFLAGNGLKFRAVHKDAKCPPYCEDAEKERASIGKVCDATAKVGVWKSKDARIVRCYRPANHYGMHMTMAENDPLRSASNPYYSWGGNPNVRHIHGERHVCTLWGRGPDAVGHSACGANRRITFQFWNSYNDAQAGELPSAYDVLACITKNDPGTFEQFCAEYGYDVDSRKAESVYRAVVKEWQKVRRFFTSKELEQLQEIA